MDFNINKAISELNFLDEIDLLENKYNSSHKDVLVNVSNWNPSKEFKSELSDVLALNYQVDDIDYIFSYTQSEYRKSQVLNKLGYSINKATLFTHSGSASIFNCINMLHCVGIKKLIVLCPAYFTLFHACKTFNIECELIYLDRCRNGYFLNINQLKIEKHTAFWVTNPVYCTSVYYNEEMISIFEYLLCNNIVVFDESLCVSSMELSRKLGKYRNFVGIYSPHKSVCINGKKFSVIVADEEMQSFLDAWSDVLCGCLSTGNDIAISHYLSNNFSNYNLAFTKKILQHKIKVEQLCDTAEVDYDKNSFGYLITVFFKNISAQKGLDINFIETFINETGIRFIPGKRNHFGDDLGFCFRINLAAYNERFYFALNRTFRYLSQIK